MMNEHKNFLMNAAYQLLTYLFPLVTITYISRTLGVENVGIYSYTYSIVYMFMLVAMLGVNIYGNREVARVRDDKKQRSKTFFSIYMFQLGMGIALTVVYIGYLLILQPQYTLIAWIQVLFLLSACVDINWFYFGLEQFKMTVIRNLIIKVASIVLVFLLVKSSGDLWKYTLIMSGSTLISQLYLLLKLPKHIDYVKVDISDILSHGKSLVVLFIPVLAFGIYRVMDKTMLGALSSVTELGYYENAERLINIPISVINALGTVMLPRMAYLFNSKDKEKYVTIIDDSMRLALTLSTIMAIGLASVAKDTVTILFGAEFEKSAGIIVTLSPVIIVGAWANVIRTQYLIPQNEDKTYVKSTIGGAILNFICNMLLISKFGAYGACVGTLLAEVFVMLYQSVKTRKVLPINIFGKYLLQSLGKSIIIIAIAYLATNWINSIYCRIILRIVIAIILFFIFNREYILSLGGKGGKKNNED